MQAYSKLTAFAALFGLFNSSLAAYTLKDDYSGSNFFSMFDFFTDEDPTHGYVDYIAQSAAQSAGLINTNNGQAYMGVDATNVASGRGRKSVRLTSKAMYNQALIILDLEHMPGQACGVWPAFWTVGPDWPSSGEIDIIEGVNTQQHNAITLHTGPGCSIAETSPNTGSSNAAALFSGSVSTPNCDINAQGQSKNAGCSIATSDTANYGNGLNANQGGVYATEWTSDVIRTWYFPRGSIPADMENSPNPSAWGTPLAAFHSTSCDIESAFKNQQIVFDTTFCGDWAGQVWSTDATCSSKAATCNEYVQNNPEAFKDAFWTVNSLKVYTGGASGNGTAPVSSKPGSSAIPTASRPPVSTGTGVPPVGPTGWSSAPGSAVPTGKASSVPYVPPMYSSEAGPTTTFTTSTASVTQTVPGGDASWGGDHTRSWSWGGNNWHGPPRGKWANNYERSVPEATVAPAPVSLPPPMVRSVEVQEDVDVNMVRRHMARHKRHEHGHGL
ncbi:hypothetical protein PMZ80_006469 [Knufia obscura]|uniref:endo-1,3(4)-beta-glucanase n=2 Tax=Knufia TaxID=430999 RepID=A0AAN8F8P4_9EURO|nr:hypothetical protein PMZ80_006469 [Knufia obscura]KAK5953381.1 hypothetical protein OHC33_005325 [Knufia fluminis]